MTTTPRRADSGSRLSRFWAALTGWVWWRRRGTTPPRLPNARRASVRRRPLGMEGLESRETISDALLGLLAPLLWDEPARAAPDTPACGTPAATVEWIEDDLRLDTPPVLAVAVAPVAPPPTLAAPDAGLLTQPTCATGFEEQGNMQRRLATPSADGSGVHLLRAAAASASSAQPAPALDQPEPLLTEPAPSGSNDRAGPSAAAAPSAPIDLKGFKVSYQAGRRDSQGQFLGGTEVMYLTAHQGMLFAGTSVWMDFPLGDPRVGAQLLRLDSHEGSWQLDRHFPEILPDLRMRNLRIEAMKSVTFTVDGRGQPLPVPVPLLLAAPSDATGELSVYSRDDQAGTWTPMVLGNAGTLSQPRALGFYRDALTGVERVFVGAGPLGTFSGVYDPAAPGRIRWDTQPELVTNYRPMAFAEANGSLFLAAKPYLYRRTDGPQPAWRKVLKYPEPPLLAEGLRGLTALRLPGGNHEVLLAGLESSATLVQRIDLATRTTVTELDVGQFLRVRWGGLLVDLTIAAYNDMLTVPDPRGGGPLQLIGLLAHAPASVRQTSAWLLVRSANGQYNLREVPAQPHPSIANPYLRAVRSMIVSPFPQDAGQVVYFAGYDCTYLPAHNSAWIYRAGLRDVLR